MSSRLGRSRETQSQTEVLNELRVRLAGPIFVVQWLFDEAQLMLLNINLTGRPFTDGQWRFMHNLEQQTRATLQDVP